MSWGNQIQAHRHLSHQRGGTGPESLGSHLHIPSTANQSSQIRKHVRAKLTAWTPFQSMINHLLDAKGFTTDFLRKGATI